MSDENCICISQSDENKIQSEYASYESDGMWFENNELNFWRNYDGDSNKVNFCPICGRKLGDS